MCRAIKIKIAQICIFVTASALFSGCSGWEVDPSGAGISERAVQQEIVGLQTQRSLHFVVQAENIDQAKKVAEISEKIYEKVMFDTNLLSFKPKQNYPIVVFRDRFEYQNVTGNPAWSGGGASTVFLGKLLPSERNVMALTSIQTFKENLSTSLLAHEICHLIFNEYMEFFSSNDSEPIRWVNEGFATFQEMEAWPASDRDDYLTLTRSLVKKNALSLSHLTSFNPFEKAPSMIGSYQWRRQSYTYTNIDVWYWQVRELVGFLIQSQGRYNFFLFLEALKSRKPLEQAISLGYPGKWRNLDQLESEWKQSLR